MPNTYRRFRILKSLVWNIVRVGLFKKKFKWKASFSCAKKSFVSAYCCRLFLLQSLKNLLFFKFLPFFVLFLLCCMQSRKQLWKIFSLTEWINTRKFINNDYWWRVGLLWALFIFKKKNSSCNDIYIYFYFIYKALYKALCMLFDNFKVKQATSFELKHIDIYFIAII